RFHALNARAVARRAAREVGKRFEEAVVVVAHLGGGLSVTTFDRGRAIDTTGALLDEGPFSPQRSGSLPLRGLLDLAYSTPRDELEDLLLHGSGFAGLLGTNDLRVIAARESTDEPTRLAVAAFVHQVCKAIGAYSVASTRPDAIAVTGGASRWSDLVTRLEERLRWIAPVICVPGELELEALAEGTARVLFGYEEARVWTPPEGFVAAPHAQALGPA
ncbi:MAG TPA: butyrate kinase, partial [Deinococcales bacterium]|nr:butyrate kinase [Deinococcales bacterium]